MTENQSNETIVRHYYNLPQPTETPKTENYRQVSIVSSTITVHLVSSFEKENIEYLSSKAVRILEYLRQEVK